MSEQSGPITREQVERAIDAAYDCNAQGVNAALGAFWYEREDIPADVRDGWRQVGYLGLRIALTRWRDELAAAEPVRRVARWDGESHWELSPAHTLSNMTVVTACDRAQAIAWGYTIEGGPEPVRDWKSDRAIAAIWPIQPAEDSPERLRERREALVLSRRSMADLVPHTSICMDNVPEYATHWHPEDIRRCEEVPDAPAVYAQHRARYAAALSAEEARLAAEGADRVIAAIGRPAPRFKVGDRVTSGLGGPWKIGRVEWGRLVPEADCDEWVYHHASGNVSACESVLALAWTPTPASPPAPEVVDVPQPLVKRCGGVEASWGPGRLDVITLEEINGDDEPFDVPIALLRAMLAAIDAQQGGAS